MSCTHSCLLRPAVLPAVEAIVYTAVVVERGQSAKSRAHPTLSVDESIAIMPTEVEASDFQKVEELHRSAGGTVWLAKQRSTGQRVVIKERHAAELGRGKEISHELELYEKLPKHPNLVRYFGSFWRGSSVLSMVFEYASGGDLHGALQQQRNSGRYLSERQVLQWFVPIAAGVQHLHANGVVHRDLKSLNVVLHDGRPKICDLGISRERSDGAGPKGRLRMLLTVALGEEDGHHHTTASLAKPYSTPVTIIDPTQTDPTHPDCRFKELTYGGTRV